MMIPGLLNLSLGMKEVKCRYYLSEWYLTVRNRFPPKDREIIVVGWFGYEYQQQQRLPQPYWDTVGCCGWMGRPMGHWGCGDWQGTGNVWQTGHYTRSASVTGCFCWGWKVYVLCCLGLGRFSRMNSVTNKICYLSLFREFQLVPY